MDETTRILVVDDEQSITELLTMALRYEGFETAAAHGGREALATVASFHPHLVVLDIMMPDIDGFEVARRLRSERQEVPILFLTARDGAEDKVRGLTIGGDDYVTKPFSVEELVARYMAEYKALGGTIADLTADAEADNSRQIKRLSELQKQLLKRVSQLRADKRRTACLKFAHTIDNPLAIAGEEFDNKPMLFPCANGVIDLETGRLHDGRPGDYLSLSSPVPFLGIDEPTDVLSFPDEADDFVQGLSEENLLGDIAISLPTATRQAEAAGHPLASELAISLRSS